MGQPFIQKGSSPPTKILVFLCSPTVPMLGWCWVVNMRGRCFSSCSLLGWPSGLFHGREMLSAFFLEPDVLQLVSLSLQLGSYLL